MRTSRLQVTFGFDLDGPKITRMTIGARM